MTVVAFLKTDRWKDQYLAPSRLCGEYLGIRIWNDWGLEDHAGLQKRIFHDEARFTGETASVLDVAKLLPDFGYKGIELYHYVLGCLSQFNIDDISYFIHYYGFSRYPRRDTDRYQKIDSCLPIGYMQWVPAPKTMDLIEEALA